MTVGKIWPKTREKRDELWDEEWQQGYDEASTWFANEVLDVFNEHLEPTQKMKSDKLTGLSLIKDVMLQGKLKISDRCKKLFWELENYRKDSSGRIPKKNDHLIDCLRYIFDSNYYSILTTKEPKLDVVEMKRGYTPAQDFPELSQNEFEDF